MCFLSGLNWIVLYGSRYEALKLDMVESVYFTQLVNLLRKKCEISDSMKAEL